jgi:hypothetical protein
VTITASQLDTLAVMVGKGRMTTNEIAAERWPEKCNAPRGNGRRWWGTVRSQGTVLNRMERLGLVAHDGSYAPWTITQAGYDAVKVYL